MSQLAILQIPCNFNVENSRMEFDLFDVNTRNVQAITVTIDGSDVGDI